jgi:hypothetical protein
LSTPLQKIAIAEKILNKINDIKTRYLARYGTNVWSIAEQDCYFLNCDAEIFSFLEKNKITVHDDVYEFGLTFGILVIKKEIEYKYIQQFGENLDIIKKEEMYNNINLFISNYITMGAIR